MLVGAPYSSGSSAAEFGFPNIVAYPTDQLGIETETLCATQDKDGIMYFGGRSLIRFDGERWQGFPTLQPIYALQFGEDGKLWAAAGREIGWFELVRDSDWEFHRLTDRLSPEATATGPFRFVFPLKHDVVFVGIDRVVRWNGTAFDEWAMPGTRALNAFLINGDVYVHYRKEGLFRIGSHGPELVIKQDNIGDSSAAVLWIDPRADGWLLARGAGLLRLRNGKCEPFAPEVSALLQNKTLSCACRLPDGRYAFGTLKNGIVLMRADGSLDGVIGEAEGIPTSYIISLFVDRDGNLWATSRSHIFRIDPRPQSRVFDQRSGLAAVTPYAICRSDGRLMLANDSGVFALDSDKRHFARLFPSVGYLGMSGTDRGAVVYGYRGAFQVSGNELIQRYSTIRDVLGAQSSRSTPNEMLVWEYPMSAIVAVQDQGRSRVLVSGLESGVSSVAEDANDRLWIGTFTAGLWVARRQANEPAKPERPPESLGLPPLDGKTFVRRAEDGTIAVFGERGAWIKAPNQNAFRPVEGYPDRPFQIVSDFTVSGAIWVVMTSDNIAVSSIGEVSNVNGHWQWTPHSIPGLDTVGTLRTIFVEQDNQLTVLWIGGIRGIFRHAVENEGVETSPRPPLLKAFARQKTQSVRTPIVGKLPFSTQAVEFEFAAPDYARRGSLKLETKLEPVDTAWVTAGRDSRRELTALREGRYTFHVRAVAETGIASNSTTFTFEVAPPWWRTPIAMGIACLVLASGVYGGHLLRIRRLRQRNQLLEDKVRERTEQLAEASAAKTMFVANMSHDIRNPLNGIIGLALALEDTRLDSQQREIVATLRECTTYLSSLVDDVLDFASIEAGRIELRPGPFVPAELLNSVVTALKAEAAERGSFITIETDPEVPPLLLGDAGRIQQILVNYLSNALKYAGGHIRIAASVPVDSHGEIEFSVADEGPGLSDAEKSTLFAKFSRLEKARRSSIRGSGLGLASCRALADAMGGAVGVDSELGKGARFFLRLPLPIAPETAPAVVDTTLPQASVLLVEDTDYNAVAATAVLRRLGLSCDRASTGEEALKLFSAKRHNIVLLDRNLPDMDGTDVARRLRELETDGMMRSVILAVTAYCGADDRAVCLKAGMDAFVGKPLTPEKLRKVLIDSARRMLASASVDTPPEVHPTTVDTSLLEYLADGSEGGVAAQAERFIAALSEAHQSLLAARAARASAVDLGNAAHRLLGHARMVGATTLTETTIRLEAASRRGDFAEVDQTLPQIAAEIAALTAALRRPRASQKA